MKTLTQAKFDRIIKTGFHEILKPLGFNKRNYNFCRKTRDLAQVINIQKSVFYSKDHIHFTINTGIFLPELWIGWTYFQSKEIPDFPAESSCLFRKRIGELRNQKDIWYDIVESTDESILIYEMQENLREYILPYFDKLSTKMEFLNRLGNIENYYLTSLGKVILYVELNLFDKAKAEYKKGIKEDRNPSYIEMFKEYGQKHHLD